MAVIFYGIRNSISCVSSLPEVPTIYDRKVRWRGEVLEGVERDPAFAPDEVKDQEYSGNAARPLAGVLKVIEADLASG